MIELLVVIAIIGVLAALLLSSLTKARNRARQTQCLSNARQITLGLISRADDHEEWLPASGSVTNTLGDDGEEGGIWFWYKELIRPYVGLESTFAAPDKLFACPADFGWPQRDQKPYSSRGNTDFNSYLFNSINLSNNTYHLNGKNMAEIVDTSRAMLIAEVPAFIPFSWHQRKGGAEHGQFNNAVNIVGFADGHASPTRTFWDGKSYSAFYDPPGNYDYDRDGK